MRHSIKFWLMSVLVAFSVATPARAGILEEFPTLKKFTFQEQESALYLGFGVSPLSIVGNKVYFTANIFQLHWVERQLDWELLSASFGFATGKDTFTNSNHFTFRTTPRFRINDYLSVGGVLGLEFVSFPNLNARFFKNSLFSPYEPFSSSGLIYGLSLSQTFRFGDDYLIKINEMFYRQTYAATQTREGWTFMFERGDVQADKSLIEPSTVFMLEVSLLY